MAEWAQQNIPDYETENITPAIQKIDDEVDLIYGHLATLRTMQAAASDPVDPETGEVYLNTTTLAVRRWNGSSWDTIVSPLAYGSGLSLDAAAGGISRNMIVERPGLLVAQISATATAPALIEIEGNLLLNATTTGMTTGHTFTGAADGWHAIYAERDGTTTNFLLKRAALSGFSPSASQRTVAHAYFATDRLVLVRSLEVLTPQLKQTLEYAFHAQRGNGLQTFTSTPAVLACNFEHLDRDAVHASGVFVVPIDGWYEFSVQARAVALWLTVSLNKNMTTEVAADTVYTPAAGATAIGKLFGVRVYLAATETMRAYVSTQASAANVTVNTHDNAFWGRWIGHAV